MAVSGGASAIASAPPVTVIHLPAAEPARVGDASFETAPQGELPLAPPTAEPVVAHRIATSLPIEASLVSRLAGAIGSEAMQPIVPDDQAIDGRTLGPFGARPEAVVSSSAEIARFLEQADRHDQQQAFDAAAGSPSSAPAFDAAAMPVFAVERRILGLPASQWPSILAPVAIGVLRPDLPNQLALRRCFDAEAERHILSRTPQWAAGITGLSVEDVVAFARAYGATRKSFIRAGFGFTRTRNGSSAMHAVSCLPAMTGAWTEKGGGAFFLSFDKEQWGLDTSLINAADAIDSSIRLLDQSRIGAVLCGEPEALCDGPPVEAMLMQNANSAIVAPDTAKVLRGLGREDLFLVVQEQFITPTAHYADIVLPATMFVEHDDIYYGLGHTHLTFGPKLVDPPGEACPNSYTVRELGRLLGAKHASFAMTDLELLDHALRRAETLACEEQARQVLIEARVVEASDTFSRNIGSRLGFHDMSGQGTKLPGGGAHRVVMGGSLVDTGAHTGQSADTPVFPDDSNLSSLRAPGLGNSAPGQFSLILMNAARTKFLNLEITALQADGKGKVISSPRVVTADNVEAQIEQGTELPYLQASSSGATSNSFRKATLSLKVKPHITPDDNVTMNLKVTKDSVNTQISGAIDTKQVTTEVLVQNGGTVGLGGIYTQDESTTRTKVPLLGDIPIIGIFFRQDLRRNDKRELLFFQESSRIR